MKNLLCYSLLVLFLLTACKTEKKEEVKKSTEVETIAYQEFGAKISDKDALSSSDAFTKMNTLQVGDTIDVKFTSKINEVCTKKGCWMKLPAGDTSEEIMVRFKDYGFFMPLDSKDKEVIVEGKAFVKITPVEELRHYAEDAGKTKEEIEKITEPKKELSFLAHGVLMK